MALTKKCGSCRLPALQGGVCPIFKETFPADTPACPKYQETVNSCELCGSVILGYGILMTDRDDNWHRICDQCASRSGTCAVCQSAQKGCKFEDPSCQIPPYVQKQVRQGNMISVVQVKNPERIRQTCETGCDCFDAKTKECNRELGFCGGYKHLWD